MRRTSTSLFLLLIAGVSFSCKTSQNTGWNYYDTKWRGDVSVVGKDAPKEVKKYLAGLLYIPGGTFTMGSEDELVFTEKDSTLLPRATMRRVTVSDFYLSDHEVTNAEYREFVKWVRDSVAMQVLAKKDPSWYRDKEKRTLDWARRAEIWNRDSVQFGELIEAGNGNGKGKKLRTDKLIYAWVTDSMASRIPVYPDTLAFIRFAKYMQQDPMAWTYFWHPGFNDYPVVGVTWHQARAYCHWLTWQVQQAYPPSLPDAKRIGEKSTAEFRLPTEAEWEYAAYSYQGNSKFENVNARKTYPWDGLMLTDNKTNYLCNFGNIIDGNGVYAKYYINDGSFLPARVKSYPPNGFQLYDMAGNVAEWTLAIPYYHEDDLLYEYGYDEFDFYSYFYCGHRTESLPKIQWPGAVTDSIRNATRILPSDNDEKALQKIIARNHAYAAYLCRNHHLHLYDADANIFKPGGATFDSLNLYLQFVDSTMRDNLKQAAMNELQRSRVFAYNPNPRIVKGGSWADGLAYIMCASREGFSEDRSSCRIGFRVAMSRVYSR